MISAGARQATDNQTDTTVTSTPPITETNAEREKVAATEMESDLAVYFWRETESATGYLSQWYYCPFRDRADPGRIYNTAEQ
jgi:hypothetical protein